MERPQAFVEDTAVAPDRLDEHLARFQEILDRHGLRAGLYGHASVGCIHVVPESRRNEPPESTSYVWETTVPPR